MLVARGSLDLGPASYRSHLAVDRDVRLFAVERRGLVFDTRVVPPCPSPRVPTTLVWLVLQGDVLWHDGSHPPCSGPVAYTMSEAHYEGAEGRRELTFRAAGEPYVALELRVRGAIAPARPAVLSLPDAVWTSVRSYLEAVWTADESLCFSRAFASANVLLEALEAARVVRAGTASSLVRDEPFLVRRVWQEVARMYGRLDTSPSLKRLADVSGVSARHLTRVLGTSFGALLLPQGGWRDATIDLRFKLAILLLSCPALTINDVARAVGYGQSEALSAAFQRAGLPSPRDVRAMLSSDFFSKEEDAAPSPGPTHVPAAPTSPRAARSG